MKLRRWLIPILLSAAIAGARPPANTLPLRQQAREVARARATRYLKERFLIVDYYRIYRKLAYPLPVRSIDPPGVEVEGIDGYPWEIWMLWALEERVNALGWAGHWFGTAEFRRLAMQDLHNLAQWPRYNVQRDPHLSVGHAARILAEAYRNWPWLEAPLRKEIEDACFRLVDEHAEWFRNTRMGLTTPESIRQSPLTASLTHNIPVIATLGLSMAARVSNHPLKGALEAHCRALIAIELELRNQEVTEAVSYDGYIQDFLADWLRGASTEDRSTIGRRAELSAMVWEAISTALPGRMEAYAPLNDVEPQEMPFHVSARAKIADMGQSSPNWGWYLRRYPLDRVRSDGLAALQNLAVIPEAAPQPGALEGLYSVSLRTGWDSKDVVAAVAASNSPSGHIQKSNAQVVLGSRGTWWIEDPGYQQYADGDERVFTIGPRAHNAPVINGQAQTRNSVRRLGSQRGEDGVCHTSLDLTAGYPPGAGVENAVRHVWLIGNDHLVVADQITAAANSAFEYTWHASPKSALWVDNGACLIRIDVDNLWIQTSLGPLRGTMIRRFPGSRGQVSINGRYALQKPQNVIWWIFNFGERPSPFEIVAEGRGIRLNSRRLSVDGK
ncbi:MAG TPA: heparinase II/III family protein [Acidobacteriota bacterium]|nr:heparinase II/III family protein [Acidobacteriota bacterium]